jgi:synaptotagmin-like protein
MFLFLSSFSVLAGLDPHRANIKNGARLSVAGEDVNQVEVNASESHDNRELDEESAPSSNDGDGGSDPVGSESDGQPPSPDQRKRKKVMKSRNNRRGANGSQENLLRSGDENSDQHQPEEASLSSSSTPPASLGAEEGQQHVPSVVLPPSHPRSSTIKVNNGGGCSSEEEIVFDKNDGQFDTIKRRKKKKALLEFSSDSEARTSKQAALLEADRSKRHSGGELDQPIASEVVAQVHEVPVVVLPLQKRSKAPPPPAHPREATAEAVEEQTIVVESASSDLTAAAKKRHRDSGFNGSSDDLLLIRAGVRSSSVSPAGSESSSQSSVEECKADDGVIIEDAPEVEVEEDSQISKQSPEEQLPPVEVQQEAPLSGQSSPNSHKTDDGGCSRSSSNASAFGSPASKHRAAVSRKDSFNNWSSDEETNLMMSRMRVFFKNMIRQDPKASAPGLTGPRVKPPQLVQFEQKLTSLMKTVPGINDEQVKEIVEYLSSEDTWSDSYDSSDYTSSDLEGAYANANGNLMANRVAGEGNPHQRPGNPHGDQGHEQHQLTLGAMALAQLPPPPSPGSSSTAGPENSPPMFAKVMQHIGTMSVLFFLNNPWISFIHFGHAF